MRWETSRLLLALYNSFSSKRTDNSRKTFQTESRTQVGDRAGSLVGLLEPESREESIDFLSSWGTEHARTAVSVHGHALGQSCATYMRDSLSLTHSNCFNLGNQCVGNVRKLVGSLLGKRVAG